MHKQSPLIVLTAKGRRAVAAIARIEAKARARLQLTASVAEVASAADVIREARVAIERQLSALPARGGQRAARRRVKRRP
jgi:hypothetical protein